MQERGGRHGAQGVELAPARLKLWCLETASLGITVHVGAAAVSALSFVFCFSCMLVLCLFGVCVSCEKVDVGTAKPRKRAVANGIGRPLLQLAVLVLGSKQVSRYGLEFGVPLRELSSKFCRSSNSQPLFISSAARLFLSHLARCDGCRRSSI